MKDEASCGFLGFIDNLKTLFYKRNKKLSGCVIIDVITALEMHVKLSDVASCFTRISRAVVTR